MHPDQTMQSVQPVYYTTASLTQLLYALYMSHANLTKMASLLRDHTLDMISQTVQGIASALSPTSTKNWTPSRCARHILTHLTPEPAKTSPPPTRRPQRRRTTTRLVPFDSATAEAITAKGGHPYIEVVLRDSKLVWDIVTHLFAKWGLPIVLYINDQPAHIRARLAAFLPEPSSDKYVDDTPVLHATYRVSAPAIPPIVFKAARGSFLLPDAPPSPPPLPPLPLSPPGPPRTHNPRTKRTYATPPPNKALHNHNLASCAQTSSPSLSQERSLSVPTSTHSPSLHTIQDIDFHPTPPVSKSLAPPPIPPLPEVHRPDSDGHELKPPVNPTHSDFPRLTNIIHAPYVGTTSTSRLGDVGSVDLKDNVSASGHTVKCAMKTKNSDAKNKRRRKLLTPDTSSGNASKRRRVFVSNGVEWLERTDPNDSTQPPQTVGLSGLATSLERIASAASAERIQEAVDCQVTGGQESDCDDGIEIPEDFLERDNLAVCNLDDIPAEYAELVLSLEGPNGRVNLIDSDNGVASEGVVEDGSPPVEVLNGGDTGDENSSNVGAARGGKMDASNAAEFERLLMEEKVDEPGVEEDAEGLFDSSDDVFERLLSDKLNFGLVSGVAREEIHLEQNGGGDSFDPAELNALLDI